jgi:hypothetical protein
VSAPFTRDGVTYADDNDPVMPFGKFSGSPCSEIDVGYLDWLLAQDWMGDARKIKLRDAIKRHLEVCRTAEWSSLD